MKDLRNYSLLRHNTFGIDATCRRFVEFESADELRQLLASITEADLPLLVVGAGSNLLLTQNVERTIVHSAIKGWESRCEDDQILLRCGSGETFDDIVQLTVSHGWHGMENLSLIPGEVGASAVQNIGAYGAEVKDVLESVEAVEIATGQLVKIAAADCEYAYRWSRFKGQWRDKYIITHVTYRLSTQFTPQLDYGRLREVLHSQGIDNPTAADVRQAVVSIRREKLPDPEELGNAGSFFKNPIVPRSQYLALAQEHPEMPHYEVDEHREKIPAAWLIDQCGWKGRALGPAAVHDKQALVLVNRGGATGEDIVRLCRAIQQDVARRFGIELQPEVNIV